MRCPTDPSQRFPLVVLTLLCLFLMALSGAASAEGAVSSEMPTRIERLRGLAEVWGMVHLFHPALADPDVQVGWWAATREAIAEVEAAETVEDYAKALQALVSKVGDQVTAIYLPDELANAAVPISLAYVDGKTVIESVLADAIDYDGSIEGWELVTVNGVDVEAYLAEWLPIASGETPGLRRAWVYEKLLAGEAGVFSSLELIDDTGSPVEISVAVPSLANTLQEANRASMSALGPGLAHLHIPSLDSLMDFSVGQSRGSDHVLIQVAAQMMGGVVLDLRSGSGLFGHPQLASKILPTVLAEFATDESMAAHGFRQREHRGYAMDLPQVIYTTGWRIQQGVHFGSPFASSVPLVVLVDEESYSVAAPFLQPLQVSGRAVVMGDVGTVPWSDVYDHALPGGLTLILRLTVPDHRCAERSLPLIEIESEPNGAPGDEDPLMLAAIDVLKKWNEREALSTTDGPKLACDLAQLAASPPAVFDREESLLGLFKLWTVAKYFYPYQELVTDDWSDMLEMAVTDVEATTSVAEYARSLQRLVAKLHDGHAFIRGGDWMTMRLPPGTIRPVEGQAVITEPLLVSEHPGQSRWLPAGQIILEASGSPVDELISQKLPLAWGGTEAAREDVAYAMLFSDIEVDIELLLETISGEELLVEVPRNQFLMWHAMKNPYDLPDPEPFWVDGRLAYLDICSISDVAYEEVKDDLWAADGVVIDLRGYPSAAMWYAVSEALFSESVRYQQGRLPVLATPDPLVRESLIRWNEAHAGTTAAYPGQAVLLIDGTAISRAETVGLNLRQRPDLVIVGESTAGTNGNITTITLPYGLSTWITGMEITHADGSQLQGIGIIPDVVVHPTIQSIREGRDEILEKGIEVLRALIEETAGE